MRKSKTTEQFVEAILRQDRAALAQGITLIESNAKKHFMQAQQLVKAIYPYSGKSIRIGITGVPGAGKSTFIESLGMYLCRKGHKVAVLAIDPSSTLSGGSILGDKTRMDELSKEKNAFIRPSPSQGKLGGVHRKTRETIFLCEAAGFDIIIVETVGVGQGETIVKDMVDVFLLLALTGAGDDLQGIKKGIIELADIICINKADGENRKKAEMTKVEYEGFLHFLQPNTIGWNPRVITCSALYNEKIDELWQCVKQYELFFKSNGVFGTNRQKQMTKWLEAMIADYLHASFYGNEQIKELMNTIELEIIEGNQTVSEAVERLISSYEKSFIKNG
ncbi:methylmalonyl Co-A mutase-associated GTPase MeaB [Bacillus sp. CGMCC 1.16541]|uniref:methylmalonyl Co-A mutase-associated GTPase MeaB n=1 Tax=Bacillus sp. CGMCC 1.16541 TaxID=2185143 RepID=UPI001EF4F258|nr:methylmalonyl Co-A mutase-associated GTPase MeaB [Bacillus sp. CGMCC 1.16541]